MILTGIFRVARIVSLFERTGCAPFSGDKHIVIWLVPIVISESWFIRAFRPRALRLQSIHVDTEKLAQSVAIEIPHGGDHYHTGWQAVRSVRRRYSVLLHLLRLQDLTKRDDRFVARR